MKKALLAFLIGLGGCVAIVDDSNTGIIAGGAGGPGLGSGGSGPIGTGGTAAVGVSGSGGNFGSVGTPGTGGSSGSGGAMGFGTGGQTASPDAGAPDTSVTVSGGPRVDAGTSVGGVRGTGGVTGTGGAVGTGGVPGTGGVTTAAVCTSNVTWRSGNGPDMRPGATCNSCHGYTIIGTIYPTAHEPTNCNGVSGSTGTRVVITGANGATLTLTPTAAGNFFSNAAVSMPFTARVTSSAGTSSMVGTQTSGNCNSCHTQNGANGALGRITVP
jgi:hypothetical protein